MRRTQAKENLYPLEGQAEFTKEQEILVNKTFGCVRFVRNRYTYEFLNPVYTETDEIVILKNGKEGKKRIYEKSLTLGEMKKQEGLSFLREVDSLALNNTKLNFESVRDAFLKQEKKQLTKKARKKLDKNPNYKPILTDYKGCPRFIKKNGVQSYTTNNCRIPYTTKEGIKKVNENIILDMDTRIHPNKGYLKLPKVGWIKVTLNRPIKQAEIRSVTIKRLKSGVYKLSILTVNPEIIETKKQRIKETNQETSIDLGVKTFIKDSNGLSIENPKHYRKAEKRLIKAQKTVSRRFTEGEKSKNYIKASKRLAKMHEKVRNQRKDFHHKLSNKYINENQVIYIEDLNVYGMLQNHKLAKSVQDCGWSSFINMLKYKAKWTGREIIEVNRFFPSSKLCHVCGYKKEDLTLKDRFWECPNCKTFHDRDENAAYNILREGQKNKILYRRDCGK